jgi:hypothetical protein
MAQWKILGGFFEVVIRRILLSRLYDALYDMFHHYNDVDRPQNMLLLYLLVEFNHVPCRTSGYLTA